MDHIPLQTALAIQAASRAREAEVQLELARMRERRRREPMTTGEAVGNLVVLGLIGWGIYMATRD